MLKINLINQYDECTSHYKKTIFKALKMAAKEIEMIGRQTINIILIDNDSIRKLNLDYRHKDYATDVISFENDDEIDELGDVFVSIDKAKEQALAYGHSFDRELGFLSVHGFLHCCGYDHLNEQDELVMFNLQDIILKKCKITR